MHIRPNHDKQSDTAPFFSHFHSTNARHVRKRHIVPTCVVDSDLRFTKPSRRPLGPPVTNPSTLQANTRCSVSMSML